MFAWLKKSTLTSFAEYVCSCEVENEEVKQPERNNLEQNVCEPTVSNYNAQN